MMTKHCLMSSDVCTHFIPFFTGLAARKKEALALSSFPWFSEVSEVESLRNGKPSMDPQHDYQKPPKDLLSIDLLPEYGILDSKRKTGNLPSMLLCNLNPMTTAFCIHFLFYPQSTLWDRQCNCWVTEAALIIPISPVFGPVPSIW